jgi:hypothetical protein
MFGRGLASAWRVPYPCPRRVQPIAVVRAEQSFELLLEGFFRIPKHPLLRSIGEHVPRASWIARAVWASAKLEAPITAMFTGSMCLLVRSTIKRPTKPSDELEVVVLTYAAPAPRIS